MLVSRGLGRVLADLATLGFDAKWGIVGAHHTGAPHKRDRIWILAYANSSRGDKNSSLRQLWTSGSEQSSEDSRLSDTTEVAEITQKRVADANVPQCKRGSIPSGIYSENSNSYQSGAWWTTDPADAPKSNVGRVAHGVAHRVDRLKAIGNGQVPAVVELAWRTLRDS